MRPFIRLGFTSKRWYVDRGRDDPATFPGTAWIGYETLADAMHAAIAAKITEPA